MSALNINAATVGNELQSILVAPDIQPGDSPSYQVCKAIYAYHPLGGKLADAPIDIAQSQPRMIKVAKGPEEKLVEAYLAEWKAIGADRHIANCARLARVFGVASVALVSEGVPQNRPVDFKALAGAQIGINVLDPLNTAGSLVLNQDPNAVDFQKVGGLAVQGQAYHRSRTVTLLNEQPLYIEYTSSGFGYVGRSIYQRALYPLKSFINTQITNDMVARKAGVLVAKQKQASSAVDRLMTQIAGIKRVFVKQAETGQVLSIGTDEEIESLNLQNLEGPLQAARRNIIEDIASSSGTPAKLLLQETFAEGFGEGTEDAKHIAQYISRIREWMGPLYAFFDKVVQYRAWNPEFYKTIQNEFPERYEGVGHTQAFYDWTNSFTATWPNLLEEPDSEKVKVDEVILRAVISTLQVFLPNLDPENRIVLIQWACDTFNGLETLFNSPLNFDYDALMEWAPQQSDEEVSGGKPPAPIGLRNGVADAMGALGEAVSRLPPRPARKRIAA